MPISRKRKKLRKEKGPTPKSTGITNKKIRELNAALDVLEDFEKKYYEEHPEERPENTHPESKEQ